MRVREFVPNVSCSSVGAASTTPPGTPPKAPQQAQGQPQSNGANPAAPNTSAILAALANIAKQNTAAPSAAPNPQATNVPAQDKPYSVSQPQNAFTPQVPASVNQALSFPPAAQPVVVPAGGASGGTPAFPGFNLGGTGIQAPMQNAAANPLGAMASMMPSMTQAGPEALQQQLMLIQVLIQQGVPQEQWATVLAALNGAGVNPAMPGVNNAGGAAPAWPPATGAQNAWNGRNDIQSRDPRGMHAPEGRPRSPNNSYQHRTRSRSPTGWGRDREPTPPRRRDSPIYGEYHGDSPGRHGNPRGEGYDRNGRGRGGRGRGNEYRQRSPPSGHRDRSASPPSGHSGMPPPPLPKGAKWMEFDPLLGKDKIKGKLTHDQLYHHTSELTISS